MTDLRTTTQTQTQTSGRTVWEIDPSHTTIEFKVKHMMFTTVKGNFPGVRGTILIDDQNPANASAEAEIDARTIDTREEQRDTHLRSADFFDVEQYPSIYFKSTRVDRVGHDRAKVYGDLTIRDVTKQVVLDTTFNGRGKNPFGQEVAGFSATTTISREEFGLRWNAPLETGGFLVGDDITIELEVQAQRKQ